MICQPLNDVLLRQIKAEQLTLSSLKLITADKFSKLEDRSDFPAEQYPR